MCIRDSVATTSTVMLPIIVLLMLLKLMLHMVMILRFPAAVALMLHMVMILRFCCRCCYCVIAAPLLGGKKKEEAQGRSLWRVLPGCGNLSRKKILGAEGWGI